MDEAILHELSGKLGGRFKLTALVQKRLVELMRERSEIITQNRIVSVSIYFSSSFGSLPLRTLITPLNPAEKPLFTFSASFQSISTSS